MPPRALTPITRITKPVPVRPTTLKPVPVMRQSQVLQTGRTPLQLSLFPRPNGAR